MRRYFTFVEGASSKFWEIVVDESKQTVKYGRIGTSGQEKTKDFTSSADALAASEKLIREKMSKGYLEGSPGTAPISTPASLPAPPKRSEVAIEPVPAPLVVQETERRVELVTEEPQVASEPSVRQLSDAAPFLTPGFTP